jgi:hypothetical protein
MCVRFYTSEQISSSKGSSRKNNEKIDFGKLFSIITEKTGWSPNQIREMTLSQIEEYIKAWNGKVKEKDSETTDVDMFNLEAGIPRIKVPKK